MINRPKAERYLMALGILFASGFFSYSKRHGYALTVGSNDPEVWELLEEHFGGKGRYTAKNKGVWSVTKLEEIDTLVRKHKNDLRQRQYTGWLAATGRVSREVCSGCGTEFGRHTKECYLFN